MYKSCTILLVVLKFVFVINKASSVGFDFYIMSPQRSADDQEGECRALGYDGLASLSTPEAHAYAVNLTQSVSWTGGYWLGLHFNDQVGGVLWDDGRIPTIDMPWYAQSRTASTYYPHGRLRVDETFAMGTGNKSKYALCGNYNIIGNDVRGTTARGQKLQLRGVSSSLASRTTSSYLKCVLFCAEDYTCRAAEFNHDLLTCVIYGPTSYTGLVADSDIQTFIRNGY